jgi:S-layer homology domain
VSGSSAPGAAVTPSEASMVSFSDVAPTNTFYPDISYLAARRVVRGIPNGDGSSRFEPYRAVKRGEFAKMIALGFGISPYTPTTPSFSDVPPDSPFYPYIEAAGYVGIVHGFTQAECGSAQACFKPERSITRGEVASIIERIGAYPGYTPASPDFSDVPPDYFAYPAIETLYRLGIVSGTPCRGTASSCFDPEQAIQRDEMSKLLHLAIVSDALGEVKR